MERTLVLQGGWHSPNSLEHQMGSGALIQYAGTAALIAKRVLVSGISKDWTHGLDGHIGLPVLKRSRSEERAHEPE